MGKSKSMPDHHRRALRLFIGVFLALILGYGIVLPEGGLGPASEVARNWQQGCKWSAITCMVVTAPVIGKVAQVGGERTLGTVIGGTIGYFTYIIGNGLWNDVTDGIVLSVLGALLAATSVLVANRLKLDTSAKLCVISFLLVTFGSQDPHDALLLAVTRVAGICAGVLLSLVLAVTVFPKSATSEALNHMHTALEALAQLNRVAWQQGALHLPPRAPGSPAGMSPPAKLNSNGYAALPSSDAADPELGLPAAGAEPESEKETQERFEAECERILMDTYNALSKCQESIPIAKSEIFIGVWHGHLCFLPGLMCLPGGGWILPQREVEAVATNIRKVARLLWTLHLTFQEGFDENMTAILQQQYPARLMPQLMDSSQGTLEDMLTAFPNNPAVPTANLHRFVLTVEGLLRISDYHRRRILQHLKRFKGMHRNRSLHRSGRHNSSPLAIVSHPSTRAGFLLPDGPPAAPAAADKPAADAAAAAGGSAVGSVGRGGAGTSGISGAAVPAVEVIPEGSEKSDSPEKQWLGLQGVDEEAGQDGRASSKGPDNDLDLAGTMSPVGSDAGRGASPEHGVGGREDSAFWAGPGASAAAAGAEQLGEDASQPPSRTSEESREAPSGVTSPSRDIRRSTMAGSYRGSPVQAFANLPHDMGLDIGLATSYDLSQGPPLPTSAFARAPSLSMQPSDVASEADRLTIKIRRVESGKLLVFPETWEGHISKVRWYSFQFLMEEMAEELQELHANMSLLIAKLPRGKISL